MLLQLPLLRVPMYVSTSSTVGSTAGFTPALGRMGSANTGTLSDLPAHHQFAFFNGARCHILALSWRVSCGHLGWLCGSQAFPHRRLGAANVCMGCQWLVRPHTCRTDRTPELFHPSPGIGCIHSAEQHACHTPTPLLGRRWRDNLLISLRATACGRLISVCTARLQPRKYLGTLKGHQPWKSLSAEVTPRGNWCMPSRPTLDPASRLAATTMISRD